MSTGLAPRAATVPNVAEEIRSQIQHQQNWEDFFVYPVSFDSVAPGAQQIQSITLQADSHFKWTASSYAANIANAAFTSGDTPIPNVSLQIQDGGTGRILFNAPVPVPAIFGTGQLPFILPIPRIFMARSAITFTLANYDDTETYNVQLALSGMKIFSRGGSVP
jgi:hypothetical protein